MSAIVLAALALGLATDSTPARRAAPAADAERVTIAFENQSLELATVYVVTQTGNRFRLGQVIPGRTERLVVPRSIVATASPINIVALSLGRRRVVAQSGPVNLAPGDRYVASLPTSANIVSLLPAR